MQVFVPSKILSGLVNGVLYKFVSTYSLTSSYGHLYNTDTSLLRTVRLVPGMPKIYVSFTGT